VMAFDFGQIGKVLNGFRRTTLTPKVCKLTTRSRVSAAVVDLRLTIARVEDASRLHAMPN
jgi:hypothetical protein